MFYSSLLFHKEVNFTLKDYFNQLFSLLPIHHPIQLSSLKSVCLGEFLCTRRESGRKLSRAKLRARPRGRELKRSADKSRLGSEMMP